MRSLKLFALVLSLGIATQSFVIGDDKDIYLDARMEVVKNKKNATYICKMEEASDQGYLFRAYYITGEVKMAGTYVDEEMETPHGEFTYYYQSGQIESNGQFREGQKYGIWQRFDEDGTEKPEKVYAALPMLKAIAHEKKNREK